MKKRQKYRKSLIILSFLIFPITIYYFSPYLIIEGAFQGILVGSGLVFISLFLLSIVFGRLFCGWLCPAAGLQEAVVIANDSRMMKGD